MTTRQTIGRHTGTTGTTVGGPVYSSPPDAPSSLTATAASDTQINLAWTDNSDNETGFRVERSLNGTDSWTTVTTTAADATSYNNTGLTAETTYYYRVIAVNDDGESDPSATDSATTQAAPITQEWMASLYEEGGYLRYRRINNLTGTPSHTQLHSSIQPNVGSRGIASDGTYVFLSGSGGGVMQQRSWNGSDWTVEASTAYGGNAFNRAIAVPNVAASLVCAVGAQAQGHGMTRLTFQDDAPYSFAKTTYEAGNDPWEFIMDFRVDATEGYGDTLVTYPYSNSADVRSFSFSGTTMNTHNSVSAASPVGLIAWDRDDGRIVECTTNGTAVRVLQLNMTTRNLSVVGTTTLPVAARSIAFCKGFLVAAGTDTSIRTYTLSGTTLALVSSTSNPMGTSASLIVSPYSDLVYAGGSSSSRIYRVTDAGAISNVASGPPIAASNDQSVVFLSSALPTL
jgi:hypothetical protein